MAVDNRLQHISNSEGSVVVLFVEACSPQTPLMVAGVVNIKNKLQRSQGLRIKALDTNLEIVPGRFDGQTVLVHFSGFFTCLPKDVRATTKDFIFPMRCEEVCSR